MENPVCLARSTMQPSHLDSFIFCWSSGSALTFSRNAWVGLRAWTVQTLFFIAATRSFGSCAVQFLHFWSMVNSLAKIKLWLWRFIFTVLITVSEGLCWVSPFSLFLINDSLSFSVSASCLSSQLSGTRFGLPAIVILVTLRTPVVSQASCSLIQKVGLRILLSLFLIHQVFCTFWCCNRFWWRCVGCLSKGRS